MRNLQKKQVMSGVFFLISLVLGVITLMQKSSAAMIILGVLFMTAIVLAITLGTSRGPKEYLDKITSLRSIKNRLEKEIEKLRKEEKKAKIKTEKTKTEIEKNNKKQEQEAKQKLEEINKEIEKQEKALDKKIKVLGTEITVLEKKKTNAEIMPKIEIKTSKFPKKADERIELERYIARKIQDQKGHFSISEILTLMITQYREADEKRDMLSIEIKKWVEDDAFVKKTVYKGVPKYKLI